jgi:urea transport system ATP-binding protein
MAILLVEQYFEFARDLADSFAVMDRGEIVIAGARADMQEAAIRARMSE